MLHVASIASEEVECELQSSHSTLVELVRHYSCPMACQAQQTLFLYSANGTVLCLMMHVYISIKCQNKANLTEHKVTQRFGRSDKSITPIMQRAPSSIWPITAAFRYHPIHLHSIDRWVGAPQYEEARLRRDTLGELQLTSAEASIPTAQP